LALAKQIRKAGAVVSLVKHSINPLASGQYFLFLATKTIIL